MEHNSFIYVSLRDWLESPSEQHKIPAGHWGYVRHGSAVQ